MKIFLAVSVGVLTVAVVLLVPGQDWWLGIAGLSATAGVIYWAGRCSHQLPAALLPPTMDSNGVLRPARWYCDRCGLEWPAAFPKEHHPIQKFTGHDESKAVSSAKRANELVDRQRSLAIERAGLRPRSASRKSAQAHGDIVHISARRTAGTVN